MKKLMMILSSVLFMSPAFAGFKTVQEAEAKLKTFATEKFKGLDEKAIEKMEDDIVDSLIDGVEIAVKDAKATSLHKECVRVAVILLKQDKTNYGGEIVLPLYKQNPGEFKNLLKSLPKLDAQLLDEAVKSSDRELQEGNG